VVAGHSSASLVARRFALDHPDKVSGLVLEASFVKVDLGATELGARLARLEDPIPSSFVREFASATSGRPVSAEFVDAMINESLKVPARVWRQTMSSVLDYDDSSELGKLNTRTLVLWGENDGIVDQAATDELLTSIPRSRLIAYEGIGHTPHWEDPARFARDVTAFIEMGVDSA
jgi:pimeloyl-ACP methyl ester carboxylesterase